MIDIRSPDDYLRVGARHKNPQIVDLQDRILDMHIENTKLISQVRVAGIVNNKLRLKMRMYRGIAFISSLISVWVISLILLTAFKF